MKTLFKLFTILFLGVKFADSELFTNQKEIKKKKQDTFLQQDVTLISRG